MTESVQAETCAANLLEDTRVERVREAAGREPAVYRCHLSAAWNASAFPFGGVVSAIAARAMRDELGRPEHPLRTMTTVFSSAVAEGELEIEVATLRSGRGMSQLQATVRNAGQDDAGHTSLGIFGAAREGFAFTDLEDPGVPDPAECSTPPEAPEGYAVFRSRFFQQFEIRSWKMNPPWASDWKAGRARGSRWARYLEQPRRADGTIDPLAFIPLCDTMPPSLGQALGPGYPPYIAPSCDLTVQILGETSSEWLLMDARTHLAADGYASSTLDLWDLDRRLVARASQLMYLRMNAIKGDPLPKRV